MNLDGLLELTQDDEVPSVPKKSLTANRLSKSSVFRMDRFEALIYSGRNFTQCQNALLILDSRQHQVAELYCESDLPAGQEIRVTFEQSVIIAHVHSSTRFFPRVMSTRPCNYVIRLRIDQGPLQVKIFLNASS